MEVILSTILHQFILIWTEMSECFPLFSRHKCDKPAAAQIEATWTGDRGLDLA